MGKGTSGSGNTENIESRYKSLSNRYNSANTLRVRPKTHLSVKIPDFEAIQGKNSDNDESGFDEV